ncbi:5-oxoprolinase (ATP-hydrolyzing) [Microdochium nivale]|nr:5-oxoprolinase (ATP-hydrolyzing) [Microdochium nivale]
MPLKLKIIIDPVTGGALQRVLDTILRAFGRCAASQDCVNSFGWHGERAVNVHSTNTRNTDPEVIEKRTAVLVRRYTVREGSGGHGRPRDRQGD